MIAARRVVDAVPRVDGVAPFLTDSTAEVENFLLVGSDSRAGADPSDPDFGGIGSDTDVTGNRSDTIMILRRDKKTGEASLLSIPRDLLVTVPGHEKKRRINSAFNDGPDILVRTVQESLGIPIAHYVEINFVGFKHLVDALGGVQICFLFPTRDTNTGLNVITPGCQILDGVQALAYARSRHYEEFRDGEWKEDPTSDLGRTTRQRDFVNRALRAALDRVKVDPFSAGRLIDAISKSIRVDSDLDPIGAASSLRTAVDGGLGTYSLPVVGKTVDGQAVLLLGDGSQVVLDFFAGRGPAPAA